VPCGISGWAQGKSETLGFYIDPTARAGFDQAFGLLPPAVLAGQRRDWPSKCLTWPAMWIRIAIIVHI